MRRRKRSSGGENETRQPEAHSNQEAEGGQELSRPSITPYLGMHTTHYHTRLVGIMDDVLMELCVCMLW